MLVIALDSPTSPRSAVDALFATNNFNAGVLIGKYARAATRGRTVTIAMLDEHAGSSVGALRHNGFLKGFGIKNNNPQVACAGTAAATPPIRRRRWRTASRRIPTSTSSTRSTSRAVGAWTALKNAGKTQAGTTIVSVDGGCAGVRNVRAESSTPPPSSTLLMASLGVAAVVKYAKGGKKASGYTDTGVNLIAKKAVAGVRSKSVAYGLANCWG